MSAVESDRTDERSGPDLGYLERAGSRTPDIPNLSPSVIDGRPGNQSRYRDGKVLTIGNGISVSGEISACDTLVVEGTVRADLNEGRNLDIAQNGIFNGSATVENAVIAGTFEGTLAVHGRLRIATSGLVKGDVRYGTLEIDAGGELNGNISVSASDR